MANQDRFDWALRDMRDNMTGKQVKNACTAASVLDILNLDPVTLKAAWRLADILATDTAEAHKHHLWWVTHLRDTIIIKEEHTDDP